MKTRTPVLILGLLLVGCSNNPATPTPDTGTKVGAEPTATTELPSPSPAPSPSPSAPGIYQMGDTVKSALGSRITVYGWSQHSGRPSTDPPPGGTYWSEIRLKNCPITEDPSEAIHGYELANSFSLVMPDHTTISPSTSGQLSDQELGNQIAAIAPGDCVKGTIVFPTPVKSKPAFVQFVSSSIAKWQVP
jgi:hypothetical protein